MLDRRTVRLISWLLTGLLLTGWAFTDGSNLGLL